MATTYTSSNRFAILAQGDPGTQNNWGTPNSENQILADQSLDGLAPVNIQGLTTYTLTTGSGQPDQARSRFQSYTGALTGTCTVTVPNTQKWGYARNFTTGGQNVVLSAGSGATMTLPPDGAWYLYWTDGAANVSSLSLSFANLTVGALTATSIAATSVATTGNLTVAGATTLTGALNARAPINLPNNTAITMADTLNAQHNILSLNGANFVIFGNGGNAGWHFDDVTGTRTLIGISSTGTTTFQGTTNANCSISISPNTANTVAVLVSSLPNPPNNFTSYISNIVNASCFHAIWQFQNVVAGSITASAGPSTLYNTTSDATLKLDDGRVGDVGQIVDGLEPHWFRWKTHSNLAAQPGFFAQQAHAVFPWAVTEGAGDHPWQMDNSKLVPVLVAELQSLRKRVLELEQCRSGP